MQPVDIAKFDTVYKEKGFSDATIQKMIVTARDKPERFFVEEPIEKDGKIMTAAHHFKQSTKPDHYFYNGFEGRMKLEIDLSKRATASVPLNDLIDLINSAPPANFNTPEEKAKWEAVRERYVTKLNRSLKSVMENEPKVFNLLAVKFHPLRITFHVDEKLQKQQDYLHNRFNPKQFFPADLKITPEQAFNVLAYDLPFYRQQLNKDNQPYSAWRYVNYDKRAPSGYFEWEMKTDGFGYDPAKPFGKMAFKELMNLSLPEYDAKLKEYSSIIKDAGTIELTPANPNLKDKVFVAGNARYKTLYIFNQNMEIQPHEPYTLAAFEKAVAVRSAGEERNTPETEELKKKGSTKDRVIKPGDKGNNKSIH